MKMKKLIKKILLQTNRFKISKNSLKETGVDMVDWQNVNKIFNKSKFMGNQQINL